MMEEETRDRISALIRQEEAHYTCADYFSLPKDLQEDKTTNDDLVSMLQECANVVTDKHFHHPTTSSSSSPKQSLMTKSASVASFSDVREMDSGTSATAAHHYNSNSCSFQESFSFWRQQMFDWSCMVVDSFGMDRDMVAMSFDLLDRYVAYETSSSSDHSPEITREDFQLFSMTCLYLAVKIMEPYPRKMGVEALVEMSRGYYSEHDIVATEGDILAALEWHVNPPTAWSFCQLYWTAFQLPENNMSQKFETTCRVLTEMAVADSFFVPHKSSHIGLACVLLTARLDGMSESSIQSSLLDNLDVQEHDPEFVAVYQQLEALYGL